MLKRDIKIDDLRLRDENSRFPDKYFNKDELELIDYFLSNKKFRIEELAKEIVKDFDLPQLEKLVVYSDGENNIVLEWNRRLLVYKLLKDPNLIKDKKIKSSFLDIKNTISIDDDFFLECVISSNQIDCYRYIDRKHLRGNNEVNRWEQERTHHKIRSGNANQKEKFKGEIAKVIKILDIPELLKEQILWKWYVTNFWRIIDSSSAWSEFWFNLRNDGKLEIADKDFKDKLKVIIFNILQKRDFLGNKIDSRSLNKNQDKEAYLRSIKSDDSKSVDDEIKKHTSTNMFGDEKITTIGSSVKPVRIKPKTTSRPYLIPQTCRFNITESKIHNIYCELKDDLLLDDTKKAVPNAVWVLFRVFLEISIDYFWEHEKWETFGKDVKLAGKITKVSDYMEEEGMAKSKQLKNIRKVATDTNNLLSIENFHSYVHSYKTQPSPIDLKTKRDNLAEFFEILWSTLQNTKQK